MERRQTMDNPAPKTQRDKMVSRNEILDSYEKGLGLPSNISPGTEDELQEYMIMNRTDIENLSPSQAIAIAVRLSQFAAYITRCINKERASKLWADEQANNIVAKEILDYSDTYLKHDMKVAVISNTNTALLELRNMSLIAGQRIERLHELANSIKNISYVISLIHKINKEYDNG